MHIQLVSLVADESQDVRKSSWFDYLFYFIYFLFCEPGSEGRV